MDVNYTQSSFVGVKVNGYMFRGSNSDVFICASFF